MIPQRIRQWWPLIADSALRHGLDPHFVAAVLDRESLGGYALEPEGPGGTGDGGWGRGLMQIDHRWHSDFTTQVDTHGKPLWQDAQANIEFGAKLLGSHFKEFSSEGAAAEACAAAAYNAGVHRVHEALGDITRPASLECVVDAADNVTTGGNYASDVIGRKARFLLPEHTSSPPPPKPPGV